MESQNDYDREVFNGDLGTVAQSITTRRVIVEFEGREVIYPYGEWTRWCRPTHTIHQIAKGRIPGSGNPAAMQHWTMLARNPLYGRDPRQASGGGAWQAQGGSHRGRGGTMKPRWTKLREWLRTALLKFRPVENRDSGSPTRPVRFGMHGVTAAHARTSQCVRSRRLNDRNSRTPARHSLPSVSQLEPPSSNRGGFRDRRP